MHLRLPPRHAAANPHVAIHVKTPAPIPKANAPSRSEVNPIGGRPIAAAPNAGPKPIVASPRVVRIQNLAARVMPAVPVPNPAAKATILKAIATPVMATATASKTSAVPAMVTGVVTMALVKVAYGIARQPSSEIEAILGYLDEPEMIHRDNMVLL